MSPVPILPVMAGMILVFLSTAAGARPERQARVSPPDSPVEVVFLLELDQPVVEARIHGEGPFRFILDTGAGGNGMLAHDLVERFRLDQTGEVRTGDPSGRNVTRSPVYRIEELQLGDLRFRDFTMISSARLRGLDGVDGVLGMGLFRKLLLTLDYPQRKIRVEAGALPPEDGKEILPNRSEHGIATVEIDVAGTTVLADIDSGSPGWILLPKAVVDGLDLASEPTVVGEASTMTNSFSIFAAPLRGSVSVGRFRIPDPRIEFADMFPRANLGGRFLGDFALTLDQANGRIRFQRPETAARAIRPTSRYRVGLMMRPDPEGLVVTGTVDGGPAARAGLLPGDRLLEINGTPLADLAPGTTRTIFSRPQEVVLTVLREGETLTIRLTPEEAGP